MLVQKRAHGAKLHLRKLYNNPSLFKFYPEIYCQLVRK